MSSTATATVMFTDVVRSTELRTGGGDASGQQILPAHFDLVREQIERHSGQEVRTAGDRFMVAFASARRAVDCAVAVQRALAEHSRKNPEEQVQVRMGLNMGETIQEQGDLFGTAVDAAARIVSKAAGGQMLVSEAVCAVVGRVEEVEFVDRGLFWIKGFSARWRLYEILWQREKIAAARALATIAERTPFIGRESERADLRRSLERAKSGHGALVMIGGEPGVGKTRIAEELVAEAHQQGLLALAGRCYDTEGASPYIPFVEILRSAAREVEPDTLLNALGEGAPEAAKLMPQLRYRFPNIREPLEVPPEQERLHLFDSLRNFFERLANRQRLLLVVEDLQWADHSTLLLLQHIAQQLHEMPILLVGTYRDAEPGVDRPLTKTLEELLPERSAHRLVLRPLQETSVAAMLRARSSLEPPAAVVQAFFSVTEGNPLFIEEIFRHLAEEGNLFDAEGRWRSDLRIDELDVPKGIRPIIGHRLARVSEKCSSMLLAAAIIGRAFSYELLEELVDLDEDALLDAIDAAERTHLISFTFDNPEVRFTFSHELIRQTLVSDLSLPRQQQLHLRAAQAIERVYACTLEEHAADLAHHLYQAGSAADSKKTVHYLTLAGDRAMDAAAFEEALRLYESGLSLQPDDGVRMRARLLYKRGLALRSLHRRDETLGDWWEVLNLYETLEDAEAVGSICADIAIHLINEGCSEEAYETARRGLCALGDRVNATRCLLLAAVGHALSFTGDLIYNTAHDPFTQALDMATELGDKRLMGHILYRRAILHRNYWQGREAAAVGLRAAELLRSVNKLYDSAVVLTAAQSGLIWIGRLEDAARVGAEAESLGARTGNYFARHMAEIQNSSRAAVVVGDLDWLEKKIAARIEFSRNAGIVWIFVDYAGLGQVQFLRGRWEEARENFQKAFELGIPGVFSGFFVAPLFRFTAYTGDKNAALAILQRSRDNLPLAGQLNTVGAWAMLGAAIEGLAVLEERDETAKLYDLALEAIGTGNLIRANSGGVVQTVAGIAAAAGERWDRAEEHYRTALRQAHEIPLKIEQAEVRRWYARMLIERNAPNDRDKARALLAEAIAMYRQICMPKHLDMAEALLSRA